MRPCINCKEMSELAKREVHLTENMKPDDSDSRIRPGDHSDRGSGREFERLRMAQKDEREKQMLIYLRWLARQKKTHVERH